MNQRLVAAVVTHNRVDQLRLTLARLLAAPEAELAGILVCDNASSDGTAGYLAGLDDPRVVVRRSDRNLGGAGGFALAMEAALNEFAPNWIVLMDDDARPAADCLTRFHGEDRGTAAFWAAAVLYPSGRVCDMNRPWINPLGSVSTFLKTLRHGREAFHVFEEGQTERVRRPIDGASFVGFFVRADTVRALGTPDPDLFLYGDDVLYSLRLTRRGHRGMFDSALQFEHDCETFATADQVYTPLWKAYFYHRNQVFILRAVAGPILFWPLLVSRGLRWRGAARYYGADASRYKSVLRRALADGLRGRKDRSRGEVEAMIETMP